MHLLLDHGLQPIAAQLKEAEGKGHSEALRLIQDLQSTLQGHQSLVDARLQALGTSPTTAVQDVAGAVTGMVAGAYNQVRSEQVSKSVRDDYTFLSLAKMAYLM